MHVQAHTAFASPVIPETLEDICENEAADNPAEDEGAEDQHNNLQDDRVDQQPNSETGADHSCRDLDGNQPDFEHLDPEQVKEMVTEL